MLAILKHFITFHPSSHAIISKKYYRKHFTIVIYRLQQHDVSVGMSMRMSVIEFHDVIMKGEFSERNIC